MIRPLVSSRPPHVALVATRVASALALVGATLVARQTSAQSASEIALAKQTAGEGLAAYNAGQFDKALGLFNQAKQIYPSAQILRMIGYSELALEHWAKAAEALEEAIESKVTPLDKSDRKDVDDQLAKATAHLGTITLHCKGAGVKVAIDGGEAQPCVGDKKVRLLEGAHKVHATAPDRVDATPDLKVEGGKPGDLVIDPAPKAKPVIVVAPPPPPPPPPPKGLFPHQRAVGLAATGVGVLAGIGALVTVIEAAHWRSMTNADVATHLKFYGQSCSMGDPRLCAYDISVTNSEGNTANQLRNAAAGLGVTALVFGAGGLALYFTAPKSASTPSDSAPPPPPPPVSMRCGAGGLGVSCFGKF